MFFQNSLFLFSKTDKKMISRVFLRRFSTIPKANTVGIVGIGEMGEKIVKKLEEDKFKLFIFDKQTSNAQRVASSNVTVLVSIIVFLRN